MEGKPAPANTAFGKGQIQLADRLGGRTRAGQEGVFVERTAGVIQQDEILSRGCAGCLRRMKSASLEMAR